MDGASPRQHVSALRVDRGNYYLFLLSAILVSAVILSIILFVGQRGLLTFREVSPLEFFFSPTWAPPSRFGAAVFILGSTLATCLAILFGAPLGLAGGLFMAKVAPRWMRTIMRPATDLFVGIPSVVYGWVGLTVLVPFIRERTGSGGFGLLAAGLILAIMILPTVISISEESLRSIPSSLEEASLALGATRWQTMWKVLLPAARPGLITAIILAMARAIGETMAVQMVIGNTPLLPRSLLTPTATLTSNIVVEMGNTPFGSTWNNALFLMAFVLLIISLLMILAVRAVGKGGVLR